MLQSSLNHAFACVIKTDIGNVQCIQNIPKHELEIVIHFNVHLEKGF